MKNNITLNLKGFIRIFILTSIFYSCSAQSIIYQATGVMDKPMPTITIKSEGSEDTKSKIYIVSEEVFDELKKYIIKQIRDEDIKPAYDFGSYRIIYTKGATKLEYVIESSDNTIPFFKNQLEMITDNQQLYEKMKEVLKRLGYVGNGSGNVLD
ncbi:hypothetical protein GWA97_13605 [Flavobacterium sp. LaA7.5]|nr:hypothetical protein [Flavobacterium salilacus subsp. altitudinum]